VTKQYDKEHLARIEVRVPKTHKKMLRQIAVLDKRSQRGELMELSQRGELMELIERRYRELSQ
jgi:hypothetical protein